MLFYTTLHTRIITTYRQNFQHGYNFGITIILQISFNEFEHLKSYI